MYVTITIRCIRRRTKEDEIRAILVAHMGHYPLFFIFGFHEKEKEMKEDE